MGSLGTLEYTYYEMGSTQSQPCHYKSPAVTRMKVVYTKTESQMLYSYGPIPGSGHECQFSSEQNKFALSHQFNTFEEAAKFCKENLDNCGILIELTLKGKLGIVLLFLYHKHLRKAYTGGWVRSGLGWVRSGQERQLYETGSTTEAICHCPRQNMQPFKEVSVIMQRNEPKGWLLFI